MRGEAMWRQGCAEQNDRKIDAGILVMERQERLRLRDPRLSNAIAKGRHEAGQWMQLLSVEGGCSSCGSEDFSLIVKDHILPVCLGGSDAIENIQPLCRTCNSSKAHHHAWDFRRRDWRLAVFA